MLGTFDADINALAILIAALGSAIAAVLGAMNRSTAKSAERKATSIETGQMETHRRLDATKAEATRGADQATEARQIITNRTPLFERMVAVDERLASSIDLLARKMTEAREKP